jgi:hypothetical protein
VISKQSGFSKRGLSTQKEGKDKDDDSSVHESICIIEKFNEKERQGLFQNLQGRLETSEGDEGESDLRVEKGEEATLSQGGPDRSHSCYSKDYQSDYQDYCK